LKKEKTNNTDNNVSVYFL